MKPKLYNTQRCPYARRTRIVLHEKGIDFEVHEVDLGNKSEEFLEVSPTGKVPVIVVDGDSLYESNVVNQYLDEWAGGLMRRKPSGGLTPGSGCPLRTPNSSRRSSWRASDATGVSPKSGSRRRSRS